MPAVGQLYKLVFGGPMGGNTTPLETWSCSIHFGAGADGAHSVGLIDGAISQWMARPDSFISSFAKYDYFKFNRINPLTGAYFNSTGSETNPASVAVLGTARGGPFQVAQALSWVTAASRGLAHAGRIYAPIGVADSNSVQIQTTGGFDPAHTLAMSDSAAQLINDLNGAGTGSCVVFSQKGQVENEIIACRVGSIPDTQRRRRRGLVEIYQQTAVA